MVAMGVLWEYQTLKGFLVMDINYVEYKAVQNTFYRRRRSVMDGGLELMEDSAREGNRAGFALGLLLFGGAALWVLFWSAVVVGLFGLMLYAVMGWWGPVLVGLMCAVLWGLIWAASTPSTTTTRQQACVCGQCDV